MNNSINTMQEKSKFGLWYFFKLYWRNTSRKLNIFLIIAMAITAAMQVFAFMAFNQWTNVFFDDLQSYETSKIIMLIITFIFITIATASALALNNYFIGLFSLKWRIHLTNHLKTQWLSNRHYDRLQKLALIDNPEQRISDDLNLMPQLAITIANQIFQAILSLIVFGCELWIFSRQWVMQIAGNSVHIPGIYLWSTLIYAIIFNVLIFTLGHNLIKLNYFNQKLTANFRYIMSLIREHSKKIALQKFEPYHQEKTTVDFAAVVTNSLAILRLDRLIQFIRNMCLYSGAIIIQLVALPAYFVNHLQIGYIMKVGGATAFFLQGLTVLITVYESIAQLRASQLRVSELAGNLDKLSSDEEVTKLITFHDNQAILLSKIKILTPDNRVLLSIDDLKVSTKKKYLFLGRTGIGKSTLLQTMVGQYAYFSGDLTLPATFDYQYIPQDAFLPNETLLTLLAIYSKRDISFNEANDTLTKVGLSHLSEYLTDEDKLWQKLLSISEKQKLCLAQALLKPPEYLFIDNSDMLSDKENEIYFAECMRQLSSTTVIVTANNATNTDIFDNVVDMDNLINR
jgi:putative ATP-binding cassette transporter